jgi:hypothetical protein
MPQVKKSNIITQQHNRVFRQPGGAFPGNPVEYSGTDGQYMSIMGVSNPVSGGIDPIQVGDPYRAKQYASVARSVSPPDFATATLMLYEDQGGELPWQIIDASCPFTLYIISTTCGNPSDFLAGWSNFVEVFSQCEVTDRSGGDRAPFDSDEAISDELSITIQAHYAVGKLGFGERAATQVEREVVAITYGDTFQCADCGVPNDGTKWLYAATKFDAGSVISAEVVYSTDAGLTWSDATVVADENPVAIGIAGNKLVVVTTASLYWAEIDEDTGVPGSFTTVTPTTWAANAPADAFFAGPREVYVCGANGYVWLFTDVTSAPVVLTDGSTTAEDLKRIKAVDAVVVASGANGTVIVSTNRGQTFAQTSADPSADTQQALGVVSDKIMWTGTDGGELYYTRNGGKSWTEKVIDGSGTGEVYDILIATAEVVYVSHSDATPRARLFSSWNGGETFTRMAPRILNFPDFDRATRLAAPLTGTPGIAANNIAIAGLADNATDGIILQGIAGVK